MTTSANQVGIQNEYKTELGYKAKLCPKQSNTPFVVSPVLQEETFSRGCVCGGAGL